MAGEIEEPFRLNFQADLLQSGSISFGRYESESLSWERRSIFPHNRYLEEVEKYSKPGSVTEKKAYFEAEFRRKALLKQRLSECKDDEESSLVTNNEMHDFEEYGNCNDDPCSSNTSNCNTKTKIQDHEEQTAVYFDESNPITRHDEDTTCQHLESQNLESHVITTQDENVAGNTERNVELTFVDHVVLVDVSLEANDDSSLACQTSKKDHDTIISASRTTFSPKVKPAAEKKITRSTLKTQVNNADWSQKQVIKGGFKSSMKHKTSESKSLPVKKTEKKSPRPATPLIRSGVKSLKPAELRSEKTVKVKAQLPLSEKSISAVRPIYNRSKPTVNPSKTHLSQSATGFSFKTDQRAENRKQFYTKVAEKMHAKEVEINQVEAKTMEKQAADIKQFRKSLNFKAKPLPSFYNESSRVSDQHKVTSIGKIPNQPRPRSQAMATRHDKNPLNIRPSSSTSSANRICNSENVGRNIVSEKKDKEKGKDTKINKQKDPEPRGGDLVKKHMKSIHTWNRSKVGVLS